MPSKPNTNTSLNRLSDRACRAAKPRDRQFKLGDGGGLYLLVKPNGSKLWQMAYREAGKQKTASFGPFPEVSLAKARERRTEAKARLADDGVLTAAAKREDAETFEAVARRWLSAHGHRVTRKQVTTITHRLERDLFPHLGDRPIGEITPQELLGVLRLIEQRGALEIAKRVRQCTSQIFRYAVAEGLAERDIVPDLRGALQASPRPRHNPQLSAEQLPAFLRALNGYDGDETTRDAVWFVLRTMVRTKEARFARCDGEWDLAGDVPLWRGRKPRFSRRPSRR